MTDNNTHSEMCQKATKAGCLSVQVMRLMADIVPAGEPSGDAGEPESHQGQTHSIVLSGEGDHSCTERIHGLHQRQPHQCHGADPTLPTYSWGGGTYTNSTLNTSLSLYNYSCAADAKYRASIAIKSIMVLSCMNKAIMEHWHKGGIIAFWLSI